MGWKYLKIVATLYSLYCVILRCNLLKFKKKKNTLFSKFKKVYYHKKQKIPFIKLNIKFKKILNKIKKKNSVLFV